MKPSISKIKKLLSSLPEDDLPLAAKLLEKREFENLMEIVDSDIYLVREEQLKEVPRDKYKSINPEDLLELKMELSSYIACLVPEDDYIENLYLDDLR